MALAEVHVMRATLNDPVGVSSGLGQVEVTVNDVTGQVTLHGSYGGLTGTVIDAHLHEPAVLVVLNHDGGTAGTLFGEAILSATDIATILDGDTWIVVHTTQNPLGELRGDVLYPRETIPCFGNGSQNVPATASAGFVSGGVQVACRMWHIASCMLHVVCFTSYFACCMLHVASCILHAACAAASSGHALPARPRPSADE